MLPSRLPRARSARRGGSNYQICNSLFKQITAVCLTNKAIGILIKESVWSGFWDVWVGVGFDPENTDQFAELRAAGLVSPQPSLLLPFCLDFWLIIIRLNWSAFE